MPDWTSFINDLGSAALGVNKGATLAAEPYAAWERVRAQELGNDSSAVTLRNATQMQDQRESFPDYYRNMIQFQDAGNRLGTAKDERDLFGATQTLAMQRALADPNGEFQQVVRAKGLTPEHPEYRKLEAAYIAQYNPQAGVTAYDAMGIPGQENRAMSKVAVGQYLEAYGRMLSKDPTLTVKWQPDGTPIFIGHNGQTSVPVPTQMLKAAAMLAAKTPVDAISSGVGDQIKVARANAETFVALQKMQQINPQVVAVYNSRRAGYEKIKTAAETAIRNLEAQAQKNFTEADPGEVAYHRQLYQQAQQKLEELDQQLIQLSQGGAPALTGGARPGPPAGPGAVAAPRALPPAGSLAVPGGGGVVPAITAALGGDGMMGPPYPDPSVLSSPYNIWGLSRDEEMQRLREQAASEPGGGTYVDVGGY